MTKLCLAVMAFSGKGKQGEEAQQNEAEEKTVEKATCYFYAQEKIRLFIQTVVHFGFTKQSQHDGLAGWTLAFGHLLSHVPWITLVPLSCMFDLMYILSSGPAPTHLSMAGDLCAAGVVLMGPPCKSKSQALESYRGRSCPAAVSSALSFPLCFLPFFMLAESVCESKRVNSHLARKLVQNLYRVNPAGNSKVTIHK